MDVAILHPAITSRGGAEQVLWALTAGLDADVSAGYVDPEMVPEGADVTALYGPVSSRVSRLAHATDDLMTILSAHQVPPMASYDANIITKLNATWYVPAPGQRLIWHFHNVPKHLYTHLDVSTSRLSTLGECFNTHAVRSESLLP